MSTDAQQRRLHREERRVKQHIANVGRAEKIHAARLAQSSINLVAWQNNQAGPRYHVGGSGWFYWHWKGEFYPPELPTSSMVPALQEELSHG